MNVYHHLLFATDLSDANAEMRDKVFQLASLFKARLSVVHVITGYATLSRNYSLTVGLKEEIEDYATKALHTFCEPLQVPPADQIIKIGTPHQCILDTVEETHTDLLILGRYGEGGLSHMLGSVSHRLIHRAGCEVLLIS